MKKTLILSIASVAALSLSGCATTKGYCKVKGGGDSGTTWECGVEGEIKQASIFRPVLNLIASTGVFTYEDWSGFNAEEFTIKLDESSSTTNVNNNRVIVKVLSGDVVVGSKEFDVYKTGDSYRFSNPSSVKSWSQSFIDSADNVKIDFATSSTGIEGANTTISLEENGTTINGTSTTFQSVSYNNDGPGEWMEK